MLDAKKITGVAANGVNINGQLHNIRWEKGILTIEDVNTWDCLLNILAPTTRDSTIVCDNSLPGSELISSSPSTSRGVSTGQTLGTAAAVVPAAQPTLPALSATAAEAVAQAAVGIAAGVALEVASVPAPIAQAAGAAAATVIADIGVFRAMTTLSQVVNEFIKRGMGDFASVTAAVAALKATGDCPLLGRVANLETRLKTACAALDLPGTL